MRAEVPENKPSLKKGMIKFYKKADGYGFVTDGETDYYFNVHALKGLIMPVSGDPAEFVPGSASRKGKSPVAREVRLTDKEHTEDTAKGRGRSNSGGRCRCPRCGALVLPLMTFRYGKPDESYCPECGKMLRLFDNPCLDRTEYGEVQGKILKEKGVIENPAEPASGSCFIATAVYGDRLAPEVIALRRFRNECLLPYAWGRTAVAVYCCAGPYLARAVKFFPYLRRVLRPLLSVIAVRFGCQDNAVSVNVRELSAGSCGNVTHRDREPLHGGVTGNGFRKERF